MLISWNFQGVQEMNMVIISMLRILVGTNPGIIINIIISENFKLKEILRNIKSQNVAYFNINVAFTLIYWPGESSTRLTDTTTIKKKLRERFSFISLPNGKFTECYVNQKNRQIFLRISLSRYKISFLSCF